MGFDGPEKGAELGPAPASPPPLPPVSPPPLPPELGSGMVGTVPVPLGYALDRVGRLHPSTMLVAVVRAAKNLSWAIGILIVLRVAGRSGSTFELIVAAMGLLQVVGAAFRYFTLRYFIERTANPSLIVQSGLIFRQRRAIPIARIQNINLTRDLAHRLFGMTEVRIETAAGNDAEASLSALSVGDAERLRGELLAYQSGAKATEAGVRPVEAEPETVYAAGVWDLLVAGATRTRVGAVVGGVIGAIYFVSDLVGDDARGRALFSPARILGSLAENLISPEAAAVVAVVTALLVGLLALLAGWLLSIGTSLVQYWNFRLLRTPDGKLIRRFGLLTVNELAFPRQRLQKLTIDAPLLQRKLGLCQITARTAGSYEDKEAAGSSMLVPIARSGDLDGLCGEVLEGFRLSVQPWRRVSPKSIRRWTVRNTVMLSVVLLVPLGWWVSWWALAGVPALVPLGWWIAWGQYRAMRYSIAGGIVVFRSGLLTRKTRILPLSRIQLSTVSESPVQRYLRLANLKLFTAANPIAADAELPNLPVDVAVRIQDELLRPAGVRVAAEGGAGGTGQVRVGTRVCE